VLHITTQSVTIDGNESGASIIAGGPLGSAIQIDSTAGLVVIRDLTIHVTPGSNFQGIYSNASMQIEDVVFTGKPNAAINSVALTNPPIGLSVKHISVGAAVFDGINIVGATGSIRDSVFHGANIGIGLSNFENVASSMLIERCDISENTTGLSVDGTWNSTATVARVSDSVITANGTGVTTSGVGQLITFRTNMLAGNTTDGSTPFSISLK
jgi:hypothetical protein